ncbi:MAG: hypothetical protein M1269_12900 [Chloroflexi bacterium]|nr:hypothetical protein [Chloroflexota bacterium]
MSVACKDKPEVSGSAIESPPSCASPLLPVLAVVIPSLTVMPAKAGIQSRGAGFDE